VGTIGTIESTNDTISSNRGHRPLKEEEDDDDGKGSGWVVVVVGAVVIRVLLPLVEVEEWEEEKK